MRGERERDPCSEVSHTPTLWPVLPRETRQGWGGGAAGHCWTIGPLKDPVKVECGVETVATGDVKVLRTSH